MSFGGKARYLVEIPDQRARERFPPVYWVLFPKPIQARCATVVLLSSHPGTDQRAGGRTAISELRFLSSLDLHGGIAGLAKEVASGRIDSSLALSVVRGLGKAAVPGIRRALAHAKAGAADFLASAFLDMAPERLAEIAGQVASLSRPVRRRFALAAGRFGKEDLIGKLLSDRANETLGWMAVETAWKAGHRREAASVVARSLDRVSAGLARRLAGLLVGAEASLLSQDRLLGNHPSPLRIWIAGQRVLTGMAQAGPTARLLLPLWKTAREFPLRFRLLQSLGWCLARGSGWTRVGPGVRKQVASLLRSEIRREQEEILRWVAVKAAGAAGLGIGVLERLLGDKAPRVRLASLRSLVQARWSGAGRALLRCTLEDPWNWVRLECSSMLERVCPRGIGGILAGQVRRYGMAATVDLATLLAHCRYPEAWPLLRSVLSGYRKGPWKAARAARLLAGAHRVDALPTMVEALRYAAARAKIHGPFERLSLDLLGALDELADVADRANRAHRVHQVDQDRGSAAQVLWSAVAFALHRGATSAVRAQALALFEKHCPAGWHRSVGGGSGPTPGDAAALERLQRACARGGRRKQ